MTTKQENSKDTIFLTSLDSIETRLAQLEQHLWGIGEPLQFVPLNSTSNTTSTSTPAPTASSNSQLDNKKTLHDHEESRNVSISHDTSKVESKSASLGHANQHSTLQQKVHQLNEYYKKQIPVVLRELIEQLQESDKRLGHQIMLQHQIPPTSTIIPVQAQQELLRAAAPDIERDAKYLEEIEELYNQIVSSKPLAEVPSLLPRLRQLETKYAVTATIACTLRKLVDRLLTTYREFVYSTTKEFGELLEDTYEQADS